MNFIASLEIIRDTFWDPNWSTWVMSQTQNTFCVTSRHNWMAKFEFTALTIITSRTSENSYFGIFDYFVSISKYYLQLSSPMAWKYWQVPPFRQYPWTGHWPPPKIEWVFGSEKYEFLNSFAFSFSILHVAHCALAKNSSKKSWSEILYWPQHR